jgi:hypothetical protein
MECFQIRPTWQAAHSRESPTRKGGVLSDPTYLAGGASRESPTRKGGVLSDATYLAGGAFRESSTLKGGVLSDATYLAGGAFRNLPPEGWSAFRFDLPSSHRISAATGFRLPSLSTPSIPGGFCNARSSLTVP